jgi:hypothetical protein
MAIYPQLASGALAQFPIVRRQRTRTAANLLADGTEIKANDRGAEITEWQLTYQGLSDEEAGALARFFREMEGSLKGFTFLDPGANLLSASDRLDLAAWHKDPLISITGGLTGPWPGTQGWQASNRGAAYQGIEQTLSAPGGYVYCFSVYARAEAPGTIRLKRGADHADFEVSTDWRRYQFPGCGESGAESVTFGVDVPAGASVSLYGPQSEPQGSASAYQQATTGGVYADAHFQGDSLRFETTQQNYHSATVKIAHAKHF